jgi:hypothetical protein
VAQKNKSLVALKNSAKAALLPYARMLYTRIQSNMAVSDPDKVELDIVVRKTEPSPVPAPTDAPALTAASVFGRNVRLNLRNPITGKRAKVPGAIGVALYSFVGDEPPEGTAGWRSEGNVTKSEIIVQFDESVAPLSRVWFTGCYYTARGLSGPACTPVASRTGDQGAEPLSA